MKNDRDLLRNLHESIERVFDASHCPEREEAGRQWRNIAERMAITAGVVMDRAQALGAMVSAPPTEAWIRRMAEAEDQCASIGAGTGPVLEPRPLDDADLDKRITAVQRVADSYDETAPDCAIAVEHRKLATWLRELRVYRLTDERRRGPVGEDRLFATERHAVWQAHQLLAANHWDGNDPCTIPVLTGLLVELLEIIARFRFSEGAAA